MRPSAGVAKVRRSRQLELGCRRHAILALSLGAVLGLLSCEKGPANREGAGVGSSQAAVPRSPLSRGEPRPAAPQDPARGETPTEPPGSPVAPAPRAAPQENPRTYRVAALGDSITDEQVGGGGYLRFLRQACPKSTFIHFGRGGDMTNQMRRRFETELLVEHAATPFDTVIVYGGVNDLYSDLSAGRTNQRIEEDLSAIYDRARVAGLRVVAVTVSPWGGFTRYFNERRAKNTRLLNSWILGTASGGLVDIAVDSYPLLSCGDPEQMCPAYQGPRPDGLHPGKKGHEILGAALLDAAFSNCQ